MKKLLTILTLLATISCTSTTSAPDSIFNPVEGNPKWDIETVTGYDGVTRIMSYVHEDIYNRDIDPHLEGEYSLEVKRFRTDQAGSKVFDIVLAYDWAQNLGPLKLNQNDFIVPISSKGFTDVVILESKVNCSEKVELTELKVLSSSFDVNTTLDVTGISKIVEYELCSD